MKRVARFAHLAHDLAIFSSLIVLWWPFWVSAQFELPEKPQGLPGGKLPDLIAGVVKTALVVVAVIALASIVYGGFRYITSRGDEREVEEAKNIITYAVIGILVIGLAYAIVSFVINALGEGPRGGG